MKKIVPAVIMTSLIFAACANNNKLNPIAADLPSPTPTKTMAPSPNNQVQLSPSPTPTPTPIPSPMATPNQKTYRMNNNYDLVPIDPNGNKKVVLLTFDDGPKDKDMIAPMLDTLDKHKAKAIFFMNGYRIKQKPELLKLVHDRGQIIGNHSWDHIELKKENNEKIDKQLIDVQNIVKEIIGTTPVFFRPPFASSNDHVRERAKAEKMLFMTWSDGSLDWDLDKNLKDNNAKGEAIIQNVDKLLHSGSNILMHELPWTVEVLDKLLTHLEEKGYSFLDPNLIETSE